MKYYFFVFILLTAQLKAFSNVRVDLYQSDLANSCEFLDEEVSGILNSYIGTLEKIKEVDSRCNSILNNSKAYLSSIHSDLKDRSLELTQLKRNKEIVNAEIARRINLGTYANELDEALLELSRRESELTDRSYTKKYHLNQAMSFGATVFDELASTPECAGSFTNAVVRPTTLLLSQVSGYLLPGSENIAGGLASAIAGLVDSFTGFLKSKFGKVEKAYEQMITDRNYYTFYKCAYKNINSLTCDLEEKDFSQKSNDKKRKEILAQMKSLDSDEGRPFSKLRLLETHYVRVQGILTQLKDIYETSKQAETKVQIQSIESDLANINLKRPRLDDITEWTTKEENQTEWTNWSRSFTWLGQLRDKISSLCNEQIEASNLPGLTGQTGCEPQLINKKEGRDNFINLVLKPAVTEIRDRKKELGIKLEQNQNTERLYREIREQEVSRFKNGLNISKLPLKRLLSILEENLFENVNKPVSRFAVRLRSLVFSIRLLLEFKPAEDSDSIILLPSTYNVRVDNEEGEEQTEQVREKSCEITPDGDKKHNCKTFDDLSKVVYKYLAKKLSDGDILTVENINATFFNYIDGIKNDYLNGRDTEISVRYSKFSSLADIYLNLKAESMRKESSGSSNLSAMDRTRRNFENLFSKDIAEKLKENADMALYGNSKHMRESLQACAIFYPMMMKAKKRSWKSLGMRRSIQNRALIACDKLLNQAGGISLLSSSVAKYPLNVKEGSYQTQCYYRNYEREVLVQQTKIIRDNEDEFLDF